MGIADLQLILMARVGETSLVYLGFMVMDLLKPMAWKKKTEKTTSNQAVGNPNISENQTQVKTTKIKPAKFVEFPCDFNIQL